MAARQMSGRFCVGDLWLDEGHERGSWSSPRDKEAVGNRFGKDDGSRVSSLGALYQLNSQEDMKEERVRTASHEFETRRGWMRVHPPRATRSLQQGLWRSYKGVR